MAGAVRAGSSRGIGAALGVRARGIEHIGSTAVPGLLAKPIIDIDLAVADVEDEPAYLPALLAAGCVQYSCRSPPTVT